MKEAATALHDAMRRYRRDRWWFARHTPSQSRPLGSAGETEVTHREGLRIWTLWASVAGARSAPEFSCTIRAHALGQRPWGLRINFGPGLAPELRGVAPTRSDDRGVSVDVQLVGESRRGRWWPDTSPDDLAEILAGTPRRTMRVSEVKKARTMALRRVMSPREGALWWIDPSPKGTPLAATQFALLLYLCGSGVIDLGKEHEAWAFAKQFIAREAREGTGRIDEGLLYEALIAMSRRYVLPQHWKGLRVYLGRVLRSIRAGVAKRVTIADRLGVSQRTLYRWIADEKVPSINIRQLSRALGEGRSSARDEAFLDAARRLADQRHLRREIMKLLTAERRKPRGMTKEGARKLIQRRLHAGETLDMIFGRVRRGRRP